MAKGFSYVMALERANARIRELERAEQNWREAHAYLYATRQLKDFLMWKFGQMPDMDQEVLGWVSEALDKIDYSASPPDPTAASAASACS